MAGKAGRPSDRWSCGGEINNGSGSRRDRGEGERGKILEKKEREREGKERRSINQPGEERERNGERREETEEAGSDG